MDKQTKQIRKLLFWVAWTIRDKYPEKEGIRRRVLSLAASLKDPSEPEILDEISVTPLGRPMTEEETAMFNDELPWRVE